MRFTARLWIGFGVLVTMLALSVGVALFDLEANRTVLRELVHRRLPLQLAARTLGDALASYRETVQMARATTGGRPAELAERAAAQVERALADVDDRAEEPEERLVLATTQAAWTAWRETTRAALEGTSAAEPAAAVDSERWRDVRDRARTLFLLAAESVAAADARGLRLIRRQMFWLALAAAAMLLVALSLARAAARTIVRPIERLTRAVDAVTRGAHHRRLPASGHDELADMARAVNGLLDRFEVHRTRADHRQTALRRLLAALLDRQDGPVVIADGGGAVLHVNRRANELLREETAAPDFAAFERRIGERIQATREDAGASERGDARIASCEPLTAGDGPPLGWLVRLRERP